MFRKIFKKEKKPDRLVSKSKSNNEVTTWQFIDVNTIESSYFYAKDNLLQFIEMLVNDSEELVKNTQVYLDYFIKIKSQYMIFMNTDNLFNEVKDSIIKLISCYNYIQSFLSKLQFVKNIKTLEKFKNGIITRLNEIIDIEERLYSKVLEASNELL